MLHAKSPNVAFKCAQVGCRRASLKHLAAPRRESRGADGTHSAARMGLFVDFSFDSAGCTTRVSAQSADCGPEEVQLHVRPPGARLRNPERLAQYPPLQTLELHCPLYPPSALSAPHFFAPVAGAHIGRPRQVLLQTASARQLPSLPQLCSCYTRSIRDSFSAMADFDPFATPPRSTGASKVRQSTWAEHANACFLASAGAASRFTPLDPCALVSRRTIQWVMRVHLPRNQPPPRTPSPATAPCLCVLQMLQGRRGKQRKALAEWTACQTASSSSWQRVSVFSLCLAWVLLCSGLRPVWLAARFAPAEIELQPDAARMLDLQLAGPLLMTSWTPQRGTS